MIKKKPKTSKKEEKEAARRKEALMVDKVDPREKRPRRKDWFEFWKI